MKKRLLILFVFGFIAVMTVQLYINSFDEGYNFEMRNIQGGLFNPKDLQKFTDLRAYKMPPRKIEKIDFRNKYDVLLTCTFDTLTPWPAKDKLPVKFDPHEIISMGKDPGLGIKELHRQGITGKGVRVAIIDMPLLPGHQEYKGKVAKFSLIGINPDAPGKPAMHGTAVASLLVGERCGTAPGASLYFWGVDVGTDHAPESAAINQIMTFNKDKAPGDKIRIVSMSWGLNEKYKNYKTFKKMLEAAKKSGLTVVLVNETISGVNCPLYKDRNEPGNYLMNYYFQGYGGKLPSGMIYVPTDNRTTASEQGEMEYMFCGEGGVSWAVPYLAGVMALGYQVNPYLQSDEIYKYIRETGTPFNRGWIINPKAFIEKVRNVSKI